MCTAPLIIVTAAALAPTATFPARLRPVFAAGFAGVAALLFLNAGAKMSEIDRQADSLREQLADLPKGAKILAVFSDVSVGSPFNMHAPSLAVIERAAYIPNLFTNTSFVDVKPAMVDLHMPQANPVLAQDLPTLATRARVAAPHGFWSSEFANDWPEQWDYLLLFKSADHSGLSDLPVCAVSATPEIILYKTEPCP